MYFMYFIYNYNFRKKKVNLINFMLTNPTDVYLNTTYGAGLRQFLFTQINIMLAVFNMIPVSPLDGSQIFSGLLIRTNPDLVRNLQIYGPQILLGAILIGYFTPISPISWIMRPFVNFFLFLFAGI